MASVTITFHALTVRPYWVRVDGQAVATFHTRREAERFAGGRPVKIHSYDPADYDDDRNNNTGRVLTLRPRLEDEPGARYRVIGARTNPLGEYMMHAVNVDNGRKIYNVTLDDVNTLY